MTLHNFWWLLIWMFLFGFISYMFIPKQNELVLGQKVERWKWYSAIILAVPYVIWAASRTDIYGDTYVYRKTFSGMPTGLSNMSAYIATREKGKGFVVLEYLFKSFVSHSDVAFFFLVALIQLFCLVYIFRKYSRNYWLSMFLFVASTDYILWMYNGIRQFIAVSLIFACIPLIFQRRYLLITIVVLFVSLIHSSALIFLPFVFVVNGRAWNRRTVFYIIGIVVAIVFVDRISELIIGLMEGTAYEGDIRIYLNDDGTNPIRILFYAVPTLMSWIFRKQIASADDPMINVCVNLSIVSTGIYVFSYFTSGILVGALPIYFSLANYILIPWLITEVFEDSSQKMLYAVFIIVYSFFFYYQCGPTWGLL